MVSVPRPTDVRDDGPKLRCCGPQEPFSAGAAASNHRFKKKQLRAHRDADNGGLKVCSVQLKTKSTGAVAALATPRRQKSQTD
jgi:hypothetical protein